MFSILRKNIHLGTYRRLRAHNVANRPSNARIVDKDVAETSIIQTVATSAATFAGCFTLQYFIPTDTKKMAGKMILHGWTILTSILCTPSYIVFMSIFSSSKYESKLWNLKTQLDGLKKTTYNSSANMDLITTRHLYKEFLELRYKYTYATSNIFTNFLDYILKIRESDDSVHRDQETTNKHDQVINDMATVHFNVKHKYFYIMSSAVDWELLRVQPVRYIWKENKLVSIFGGIMLVGGLFKLSSLHVISTQPMSKMTDPTKKQWGRTVPVIICTLMLFNLANLTVLLKTYVPPRRTDKYMEDKYDRLCRHM